MSNKYLYFTPIIIMTYIIQTTQDFTLSLLIGVYLLYVSIVPKNFNKMNTLLYHTNKSSRDKPEMMIFFSNFCKMFNSLVLKY